VFGTRFTIKLHEIREPQDLQYSVRSTAELFRSGQLSTDSAWQNWVRANRFWPERSEWSPEKPHGLRTLFYRRLWWWFGKHWGLAQCWAVKNLGLRGNGLCASLVPFLVGLSGPLARRQLVIRRLIGLCRNSCGTKTQRF